MADELAFGWVDRAHCWSTCGIDAVAPGERHALLRRWASPQRRPALWFHGVGDSHPERLFLADPIASKYHAPVVAGVPCYAGSFGGATTFGNAAFRASLPRHLDWLERQGLDTSRVALIGTSHGAVNAAVAASILEGERPGRVACLALQVAPMSLRFVRDTNALNLASVVEDCWGGPTGFEAPNAAGVPNCDAVSPLTLASSCRAFPVRVYWAGGDELYEPGQVAEFCARSGAESVYLGDIGHSTASPVLDEPDLARWVAGWL